MSATLLIYQVALRGLEDLEWGVQIGSELNLSDAEQKDLIIEIKERINKELHELEQKKRNCISE